LHNDPNVITDFTMTGATGFLAANQGITFTFIKPAAERKPIGVVTAEMMGKLNTIPGVMTFLRPFPVLEISTGVTSQQQGQYAFTVSGANPSQVYEVGQKLMGKLHEYPGFLSVSSDFYNNTPNLNIDIKRVFAECDFVITHGVLSGAEPVFGELGNKVVDIFRLDEDGKIVEHWDVLAPISAESENGNPEV